MAKYLLRTDFFGEPIFESELLEARKKSTLNFKKLWKKAPHLEADLDKKLHQEFAEYLGTDRTGYGNVERLAIGHLNAVRLGIGLKHAEKDQDLLGAALVWTDSGEVLLKKVEKIGHWKYPSDEHPMPVTDTSGRKAFYDRINAEIEEFAPATQDLISAGPSLDSNQDNKLPENWVEKVAPKIASFEMPKAVQSEAQRKELISDLQGGWLASKERYLDLFQEPERSLIKAEMPESARPKNASKLQAIQTFHQKITTPVLSLISQIKALPKAGKPQDDGEEDTREAGPGGFKIGDAVKVKHPKYGMINATVKGFKDGKVVVRHKDYGREAAGYYVVGTELTAFDPSDVSYRTAAQGTSRTAMKAVEKVILDLPSINQVRKETEEWFETTFTEQTEKLKARASKFKTEVKTKKDLSSAHYALQSEYQSKKGRNPLRDDGSTVSNGIPGYEFSRYLNDDLSLDKKSIQKDAKEEAAQAMMDFVKRSAEKAGPVIETHGGVKTVEATSLDFNAAGFLQGGLRVTFENGDAFSTRSKLVWKYSTLGKLFYQFPTTFHDVQLGSAKYRMQDENWMNNVFAKKEKE